MFNKIIFASIALLTSGSGFADIDLNNLSGAWRIEITGKPEENQRTDFVLTKSPLKMNIAKSPKGTEASYYQIQGDVLGMRTVGLALVSHPGLAEGSKPIKTLNWVRLRQPNDSIVKGTELDGESNRILRIEGDTIILAGDKADKDEVEARLTRLPIFETGK